MLFTLLLTLQLHAENKTCEVKGMVCQGCVDMVTKGVCGDAYSTCSVRLKDKKKKLGEITLVTKDPAAKIDVGHITHELDQMTYVLSKCVDAGEKSSAKR